MKKLHDKDALVVVRQEKKDKTWGPKAHHSIDIAKVFLKLGKRQHQYLCFNEINSIKHPQY